MLLVPLFLVGGTRPLFPNEVLFPSAVFLMQFMSHKSEIVLIKRKTMQRAKYSVINSVNDIYILRKHLGCQSPPPDHILVIKITST